MSMQTIFRSGIVKPVTTADEAVAADRRYFDERPDEEEYIRKFVPGEFGKMELPEIPEGFRYATHVSATLRAEGQQVRRYLRLMAVVDTAGLEQQGLLGPA
jgi:hypothetical protein